MKIYLDLDLSIVLLSQGMSAPLKSLRHKYGEASRLEVVLMRSGEVITPTETEEVVFVIKPVGEHAASAILGGCETFTYEAATGSFVGAVDYNVTALKNALQWGDAEELKETPALWAEFSWRPNSSAGWQRTQLIEDFRLENVLFKGDEVFPASGTPIESGGPWLTPLVKSITGSPVVNSTTTLAAVTGLSFAVENGKMYKFRASLIYTSAATTTGARFGLDGPASPTFLAFRTEGTGTSTTRQVSEGNTAYTHPAAAFAASLTTGNIGIVEGFIRPSADGNVTFQFASEVGSSAISVLAGSCVEYIRLD